MPDESLSDWCERVGACPEAVDWVGTRDWQAAWDECERGDWMLWALALKVGAPGWPTKQQIVLCACDIAETVLEHVPEGDDRPRNAIDAARHRARGDCELEEVAAAASAAAYAAYSASYSNAADAAAYAAYSVAGALYANYAYHGAFVARYSAYAKAGAFAAECDAQLKRFADMIRERFTDLPFQKEEN